MDKIGAAEWVALIAGFGGAVIGAIIDLLLLQNVAAGLAIGPRHRPSEIN